MDEIIKAIKGMKDKIDAALKPLPPTDQVPAASEMGYALRCVLRTAEDLKEMMDMLSGKATELSTKAATVSAEAEQKLRAELVKSGEFMTKADAEAAAKAAAEKAHDEAKQQFDSQCAQEKLVAERRAKLVADKELPAAAANAMSAADLSPDNFMENVKIVKGRIAKLTEAGINAEEALGELAKLPIDAEGCAEFDRRSGMLKKVVESTRGTNGRKPAAAPLATPPSGTAADRPLAFF